jgi:hypothetical protein
MKILIIGLPRTGSTRLGSDLSTKHKCKYIFEPYNPDNPRDYDINEKNIVLKTLIFQKPEDIEENKIIDWLVKYVKNFDEVILLKRKNMAECIESWAYLNHMKYVKKFTSLTPYLWEKTPNYKLSEQEIKMWDQQLVKLSELINVPITYYEDIFDPNSEDRLRRGNKSNEKRSII